MLLFSNYIASKRDAMRCNWRRDNFLLQLFIRETTLTLRNAYSYYESIYWNTCFSLIREELFKTSGWDVFEFVLLVWQCFSFVTSSKILNLLFIFNKKNKQEKQTSKWCMCSAYFLLFKTKLTSVWYLFHCQYFENRIIFKSL